MGRRLQTIYEFLSDYQESDINAAINELGEEEQEIIIMRYGDDLHNPVTSKDWNSSLASKFYGSVIPKLKGILVKSSRDIINIETDSKDLTFTLIELLKSNISTKEICDILKVDEITLYKLLLEIKNKGVSFLRKYNVNGEISYQRIKKFKEIKKANNKNNTKTIYTPNSSKSLKTLAISDLYIGNEAERLDLLDRAFNYCIKNNIHIIFCGGDIIDGAYSSGNQKITNIYKQTEYFIANYPHDKSIITFAVGGDHDYSALYRYGIDISEMCNNYRHDIVIGGFNNTIINMKKDKIQLYHYLKAGMLLNVNPSLIFHGHFHNFQLNMQQDRLNIVLPSLSDITDTYPQALEVTLNFKDEFIESTDIKQIVFDQKDIILSNTHSILPENRKIKDINLKDDKMLTKTMSSSIK